MDSLIWESQKQRARRLDISHASCKPQRGLGPLTCRLGLGRSLRIELLGRINTLYHKLYSLEPVPDRSRHIRDHPPHLNI